ncbi:response regulator transcription factor [Alkalicoccus saliphilus]|nr:helix-turn-helix domain-containing protein [Alkalicoccus saliphilus]
MYRVMLIDDEPLLLQSLKETFPWSEYYCEVTATASNGREALHAFEEAAPDIVVTDIKMPDMDGISFLKEVLQQRSVDEIIVLSGYDDFKFVRDALKYKAFHYLLKPLDRAELGETLLQAAASLEEKRKTNKRFWKEELIQAATQHKQEVTLPFSSFSLFYLTVKEGKDISWKEKSDTSGICFSYPLGPGTVLLICAGDGVPFLEEELSKYENALKKGAWSSPASPSQLAEALDEVYMYAASAEYMDETIITPASYSAFQEIEPVSLQAVRQAKTWIDHHLSEPLRSEETARHVGLSPSYFSTVFKQTMHISFSDYVKQRRMEKAEQLLRETNKPAYEIALLVGYEDQRYFSQIFRRHFHMTPSAYRREHQST